MSFGNTTEIDLLNKIFKNTALPFDGITDIYISMHTADPGEAGNQATNEANYTSYARVAIVRSAVGWTVAGSTVQNASLVQFPQCTGGTNVVTHVSIGTSVSGAGQIIASGALNSPLTISNLIQPQFSSGALTFTID